jgi:tRNA-specific 2-thiouridylase
MRIAGHLGLKFYTFDFEAEYRKRVYEYMIEEYRVGRTPNPDVLCNKYMKFDLFLKEADALGCDYIATGHYARRIDRRISGKGATENTVVPAQTEIQYAHLLTGVDENKDQSYFLCQLNQDQLRRSLFPVGEYTKPQIRDIARKYDLFVAEKKDSQGICFIGNVNMQDFLEARIAPHEGNIVTTDGRILGKHRGFEFYTIGQREGLGVGGGTPLYVVERRAETNEVVVALGPDDPALFRSELCATNLTETVPGNIRRAIGTKMHARIRYRQPLAECSLSILDRDEKGEIVSLRVVFDAPQRAIAPGQFVAFYDGEELIGSGIITS